MIVYDTAYVQKDGSAPDNPYGGQFYGTGSYNADGTERVDYTGRQSPGAKGLTADDLWDASIFKGGFRAADPGFWQDRGVEKNSQADILASLYAVGASTDVMFGMGGAVTLPAMQTMWGVGQLADQWGWADNSNRYQNVRGYSDKSIVYDYKGNPADQVARTPSTWSGSGVPLAITGGAEGWAVSKPLPPGEEFTPEELFKDYGLYWKGWSTEQVAGAAKNLFGQMTEMTMLQSRDLADKLYAQASARADRTIATFPDVSQRALDATRIAGNTLTNDMANQFTANLDTYMPGWREKIIGSSGALTEGTTNVGQVFKDKILPELSYNLLQTRALLQNASRPMLAGEVPMSVSLAALGNQRGTSASGRGLSARDLGVTSRDLRGLGYAGITAASGLQSSVDKGVLGIFGAQGEAARAHAAAVGQFTPPIVDTGSLYGGIMQGLNAGATMKPDQIFSLGMQSYESQLNAGMNLFGQLQQLAVTQAETFNKANEPAP